MIEELFQDEIAHEERKVVTGEETHGENLASFFFNEILDSESDENEDPFDMLTKGIKVD